MARREHDELAAFNEEVAAYCRATDTRDAPAAAAVLPRLLQKFGARAVELLLVHAASVGAEKAALQAALAAKSALLEEVLRAPRRLARLLGVVTDDGTPWGVLSGTPLQAVRFRSDVDVADLTRLLASERVWVWLIDSGDGLVIAGKWPLPPGVEGGLEREFVYEGLADE